MTLDSFGVLSPYVIGFLFLYFYGLLLRGFELNLKGWIYRMLGSFGLVVSGLFLSNQLVEVAGALLLLITVAEDFLKDWVALAPAKKRGV